MGVTAGEGVACGAVVGVGVEPGVLPPLPQAANNKTNNKLQANNLFLAGILENPANRIKTSSNKHISSWYSPLNTLVIARFDNEIRDKEPLYPAGSFKAGETPPWLIACE